jgi:hypothetical protein
MISKNEFQAIAELDLDPIKVKLMHKEGGEGWTLEYANSIELEYRRFLYLMKMFPNEVTAPLEAVDTFWHYHILDTMKYMVDCDSVFGYFLHHFPYLGMRGADDEEVLKGAGARMQELYEETFDEAYVRSQPRASAEQTAGIVSMQAATECCYRVDNQAAASVQVPAYCYTPSRQDASVQTAAYCYTPSRQDAAAQRPAYCYTPSRPDAAAQRPAYCYTPSRQAAAVQQPAYCYTPSRQDAAVQQPAYCYTPGQKDAAVQQPAYCYTPGRQDAAVQQGIFLTRSGPQTKRLDLDRPSLAMH